MNAMDYRDSFPVRHHEPDEVCNSCRRDFAWHPWSGCTTFKPEFNDAYVYPQRTPTAHEKCKQCGAMYEDHAIYGHIFIGGDTPETRYIGA
jgi:hypothetical protein